MDNYYQLLGITRNATAIEVKAAFQQKMKALEASPVQGERRKSQEKMLQQAFLTLLDMGRRARYDKQVDATAGPVVVLEEARSKGVSILTVTFVTALLVASVAGGWYVTHPPLSKKAQERKEADARSKAARERVQTAAPKGNPNPIRKGDTR